MCKKNEYYDIDIIECLFCLECLKIFLECFYFGDMLCEKDVLVGF